MPSEDPWAALTDEVSAATEPLDCGPFPAPTTATGREITYDTAGVNALEQYRTCSEANRTIGAEHAAQVEQLKITRKALIEAGKGQRRIAEMRREILEEERRHMFWERLQYWAVIAGLAFAL